MIFLWELNRDKTFVHIRSLYNGLKLALDLGAELRLQESNKKLVLFLNAHTTVLT